MRFNCRTTFDITATGVVGHCNLNKMPFNDRSGQDIVDTNSWNRSRNQQRNWETLTQLISLRSQIFDLTNPVNTGQQWSFEFEVETSGIFGPDDDPVAVLREDAAGIPMINIDADQSKSPAILITSGPDQNIWFDQKVINN